MEPLPAWFPAALDEQLLFATTPVFFEDSIIGSGFFYRPKSDEKLKAHFLVTAFHVLQEILRCATTTQSTPAPSLDKIFASIEYHVTLDAVVSLGTFARCSFPLSAVRVHASKDLAVVRINPGDTPEKGLAATTLTYYNLPSPQGSHKGIFFKTLSEVHLRSDKEALELLTASAQVIIPGYPDKHWDEKNRFPMLRTGTTAAHHALHFNGDPYEGRLDVTTSHNDSGAPIIARTDPAKIMQVKFAIAIATRQAPQGILLNIPDFSFLGIYIGVIKTKDGGAQQPLARYLKGSLLMDVHNWRSPVMTRWFEQLSDPLVTEHSSPKLLPIHASSPPPTNFLLGSSKSSSNSSVPSLSPLRTSSTPILPKFQHRLDVQLRELLAVAQSNDDNSAIEAAIRVHKITTRILMALNGAVKGKRLQTPAVASAYGGLFEIGWWPSVTIFVRPHLVRCFDGQSREATSEWQLDEDIVAAPEDVISRGTLQNIANHLQSLVATIWADEEVSTDSDSDLERDEAE